MAWTGATWRSGGCAGLLAAAFVVVLLLALPGQAGAATAEMVGTTVALTSAPGDADYFYISEMSPEPITSLFRPITGTNGCTNTNASTVRCPGQTAFEVRMGDGDDRLRTDAYTHHPIDYDGGPGKDHYFGTFWAGLDMEYGPDGAGSSAGTITGLPHRNAIDLDSVEDYYFEGYLGDQTFTFDTHSLAGVPGSAELEVWVNGDGTAGLGDDDRVVYHADGSPATVGSQYVTGMGGVHGIMAVETVTVEGTPGADTISGTDFPGTLVVNGAGGDDTLRPSAAGPSTLNGGSGTDTVAAAVSGRASLSGTALTGAAAAATTLTGVEAADITGSSGADELDASAFGGSLTAALGDGDDRLVGGARGVAFDGGAGRDEFARTSDAATIQVRDAGITTGAVVDALTGVERRAITGGAGANRFEVTGTGATTLDGAGGTDVLATAFAGSATLSATALAGAAAPALTFAGIESVELDGSAGADELDAGAFGGRLIADLGAGDDELTSGDGADVVTGGVGADTIATGAGADEIHAQDGEVDRIDCGDGTDDAHLDPADVATACDPPVPPPGGGGGGSGGGSGGGGGGSGGGTGPGPGTEDPSPPVDPDGTGDDDGKVPTSTVDGGDDGNDDEVAPLPRIPTQVAAAFRVVRGGVLVTKLGLATLPAGSAVRVTCAAPRGRRASCPYATRTTRIGRATRALPLAAPYRGKLLAPGTRVSVRVLAPAMRGTSTTFTIRRSGQPSRVTSCLTPVGRPARC